MGGEQLLTSLHFVIVLHLEFLEGQEGARVLEGVRRALGGDHRLDVAILGIQPAEKVEHSARLRDGLPNVTELVGEALEGGAVLINGGVALHDGAQFGLEVDGTVQLVVEEETLDVLLRTRGL